MTISRAEARHQRVWALLPWYANGTLEAGERRAVEDHLADCPACTRELAACRELGTAVKHASVPPPAPHPVQLRRLLARIDELPAPPAPWPVRLRRWVRWTPERLGGLVLLQSAALLVLVLIPGSRAPEPPSEPAAFHTLTAPEAVPSGPALRVVFAEGATVAELRTLLAELGAEIVAGPSRHGVCTVRLAPGADRDTTLARLRRSPAVVFAEPVAGDPAGAP